MLLVPSVIALNLVAFMVVVLSAFSSVAAARILIFWDPRRDSDRQINLEARTYLVSTLVSFTMILEALSLFLFIETAERTHPLFTGAMCAAGVLNAAPNGFTTLVLKTLSFVLCIVWLTVNRTDDLVKGYTLIRLRYAFVPILSVLFLVEGFVQFRFLALLDPEVITSCCGTLFTADGPSTTSIPLKILPATINTAFFAVLGAFLFTGVFSFRTLNRVWTGIYALSCIVFFLVSILTLTYSLSPLIYQLPIHSCPFCVLKPEYGYTGYFLYLFLLISLTGGLGAAVINSSFRNASDGEAPHRQARKLVLFSMIGGIMFTLVFLRYLFFSGVRF